MNNLKENFLILLSIIKQSLQNLLDANGNLPKTGPETKFSTKMVCCSSMFCNRAFGKVLPNQSVCVFIKLSFQERYG